MPGKVFEEYCSKQLVIMITPSMDNDLIEEANRREVKKSSLARELILAGLSKGGAASLRENALKLLHLKPQDILSSAFVFVTRHGKKFNVMFDEEENLHIIG